MAVPVLTDLWAVYNLDGTVYLRIDEDGDIIGAAGGIDLGTTSLEIGDVYVASDKAISLGDAQEATLEWVSASADLVIDNTSATGSTILRLGTDTAATDWQLQNNSASPMLAITGAGALTSALSTVDIQGTGAVTIDSSAGAISIGSDAAAQAVNIATGNAARVITIGHSASASLALEGGVGAVTMQGDTTIDIDAGTALGIESSGGAISVGADAVAQAVNIGTGAAARVITIGNAASASLAVDSGVGAWTVQGDTTGALTAGTGLTLTAAAGGIVIDAQGATAIAATLGADDTTATFRIRNNSNQSMWEVDGAGTVLRTRTGAGTGRVLEHYGTTIAEGWQHVVYEATVATGAVENAILTIPAGSIVDAVLANVESALTGGGTTATWSLGITGDVDAYGTATSDDYITAADLLTQNSKWSYIAGVTPIAAAAGASIGLFSATAVALKLIAAATGGAAAGDTALTVGTVRVRVEYRTVIPMADAV